MHLRKKIPTNDQAGFAAIIIALVLILVLSLLTVGFAQLMRHEQLSALEKQLSSQAYYAAETGVNDAVRAINDGYNATKNSCSPPKPADSDYSPDLTDNTVGGSSGPTAAEYTCLLINPTPPQIHYTPDTNASKVVYIEGVDKNTDAPINIQTIGISWEDANGSQTFAPACGSGDFQPLSNWSYPGILRFQLIPLAQLDRNDLIENSYTAFFCPTPTSSGRTWAISPYTTGSDYGSATGLTKSGVVVNSNCDSDPATYTTLEPNYCNVEITGLGVLNETAFFLNMQSIYKDTSVTITAYDGAPSPSTQLDISGAQTIVDSTGRAQNVLRRIQVGIPSKNGYWIPSGTHGNICKQLQLEPPSVSTPSQTSSYCAIQP
jgi:type II secretory pathway pseudopilin PulG